MALVSENHVNLIVVVSGFGVYITIEWQLTQWLLGWWISVVGNVSTGSLDRQRCCRFDPQKCIWFLWWGKCLCT